MRINLGGADVSNMSAVGNEVSFSILKLWRMWTVLLCFSPSMSGHTWTGDWVAKNADHKLPASPNFDNFTIRHVDAVEGQTLLLPCVVRNVGDRVVSWIRTRDLHILSSGPFAFSSDNRFEPVSSHTGDSWSLRIRGVRVTDTGQYECQVNTDPKMSLAINLTVSGVGELASTNSKWVGKALIKGPSKVYVRDGSPATFTCEISPLSVASPQSGAHRVFMTAKPRVRWLHDNKELFFEGTHARISMDTHYGELNWRVTSILKISAASGRDSGQYTCLQMSVQPAQVRLMVVEGEHSEPMQRDFPLASRGSQSSSRAILMLLFVSHLAVQLNMHTILYNQRYCK